MFDEVATKAKTLEIPQNATHEKYAVDIDKRIDVTQNSYMYNANELDVDKRISLDTPDNQIYIGEKNLEPRHEFEDGHENYYDDNGNIFRVDNHLLPNMEYEVNTYKYVTDDRGRIISASGQLHLKEPGRKHLPNYRDDMNTIGKGEQMSTDDKGHLIGDRFDGTNGLENMVAQDSNINKGDFKDFEGELAREVGRGADVRVDIQPIYRENSMRPDAIVAIYSIDGDMSMRTFPNSSEGEKNHDGRI